MNRRSRLPTVVVLIVSIVAAGFFRHWAAAERRASNQFGETSTQYSGSATGLGRMNSFALALLLGGLRGPLVMFLWPSAEQQKQEKNLEDFDTKIEWIRMLQAEFDTVHIFQIWNKAYNISVQMANLGNKYRTILDALEYARSVDAEKPNDINIVYAIGGIFFDKLGNSAEKTYYRERVREETMARLDLVRITLPPAKQAEFTQVALDIGVPLRRLQFSTDEQSKNVSVTIPKPLADLIRQKLSGSEFIYADRPRQTHREEPGVRRSELDPVLDPQGHILPDYLKGHILRPANLSPDSEWNDGSELQYLKRFDTAPDTGFPYGISPLGLAYNYFKRAQILQSVNKQKHAQLSDLVVDSRPALTCKYWSEEEWERGRRAEMTAFDKQIPSERTAMETPSADLKLDAQASRHAPLTEAIFQYERAAELCDIGLDEYQRHVANFQTNITTYISHMDEMRAHAELIRADHDFLVAIADPSKRTEMTKSSAEHYRTARQRTELITLTYYTTDEIMQKLYPQGVNKGNIARLNLQPDQIHELMQKVLAVVPRRSEEYQFGDEFSENVRYLQRIEARLSTLGQK